MFPTNASRPTGLQQRQVIGARLLDQKNNPLHSFADWESVRLEIPNVAGLYAIYEGQKDETAVYIGMALGNRGLRSRLAEHWNLGQNVRGDQLKYYIAVKRL